MRKILKPDFGDIVENGWASEDNPTRRGFFVREFRRSGKLNPGRTWEITDGKGKFWEFNPKDIAEEDRLKVIPAGPLSEGAQMWALVERLRETEGAGITICAPNADFSGPNEVVEVCADWTNWEVARFPGETVFQCLKDACRAAGIPHE